MAKNYSKRYKLANRQVDKNKTYNLTEAIELAKKISKVKFNETVEIAMRLNVDPKHADQQIRGSLVLPSGTGKNKKILVLTSTKENDALKANADHVGNQDLITKIEKENWFDFDIIVATPEIMPKLGKLGKLLGPKGLMPNPKLGTVTTDVIKAIEDIKKGKLIYRVDKNGNMHLPIGKTSFTNEQLENNYKAISAVIKKSRPTSVKGDFIKNITLSTTMGPGIKISF